MLSHRYRLWIATTAQLAVSGASPIQLLKRSGEVPAISLDLTLGVEGSLQGVYLTNVSVGTPPQLQTLALDQSILTIVPYSQSSACQGKPGGACLNQGYDPSQSSTQAIVSSDDVEHSSLWADPTQQTKNKGNTFRDDFTFAGTVLTNKTFLLGVDSASPQLGLGISLGPASGVNRPGSNTSVGFGASGHQPQSLVAQMTEQGLIRSSAFSIALDNDMLSKGDGVLMLGAIDMAKYTGSLVSLQAHPHLNSTDNRANIGIALTSLRVVSSSGSDELFSQTPLFVASGIGTSFTVLPEPMARLIYAETGAEWNATELVASLPCSRARRDAYFSFQFHGVHGPVVNISMADLMVPLEFPSCHPRAGGAGCSLDNQGLCQLLILPHFQSDPPILLTLGEPFLRNAYTVYDQETGHIGIAQAKYSTESKIVPFESRGASIPSSTPGPEVDPPVVINQADADYSHFPVASIPRLLAAPGILNNETESNGLPLNTSIGLGVGTPLGVLAALSALVAIWVLALKRPVKCLGRVVWPKSRRADKHELDASASRSNAAELYCPSDALEERNARLHRESSGEKKKKQESEVEVMPSSSEKVSSPISELSSHSSIESKAECGRSNRQGR